MKVKAINKSTNQQFDCEEIEIKRYKYYLYYNSEPKRIGQYYITKDNQVDIVKTGKELGKPILCTNNPNIDCPQVVDEVEKIAEEWFLINGYNQFDYIHSHRIPDAITTNKLFKTGYKKSQETHPNSDEDMKSFLKFSIEYRRYNDLEGLSKTSDELLQLWKEQQPKTIYYE